jgi:tetratricopeptide (TPR) repeat protein
MNMEHDMNRVVYGTIMSAAASALMWALLATSAAAQTPKLSDVDLCNGRDRSSPELQISGCTELMKSDINNSRVMAIAYNNRGNAYTTKGEYDLAIRDYDQSIKLNPNYAKPLNNRGVTYQKKGEYDRAVEDFNAAIKIDPNYADAFYNRATTYQKQSDYRRAVKDFDEAIRLQPAFKATWNERCWSNAMLGDLQAALADCNKAVRLEPNAAAYDSRGVTFLKLGRWRAAISDFDSALRLDPKLASALYGRGFAELKRGDRTGGNSDVAAAKALEHDILEHFAHYGLQ